MTAPDELPDDIAELKAIIRAQQDQNARLVEDCDAAFFDFKGELQKSSFESAVVALRKNGNWDDAKRKTKDLYDLLSGASDFQIGSRDHRK